MSWCSPGINCRHEVFIQLFNAVEGIGLFLAFDVTVVAFAAPVVKAHHPHTIHNICGAVLVAVFGRWYRFWNFPNHHFSNCTVRPDVLEAGDNLVPLEAIEQSEDQPFGHLYQEVKAAFRIASSFAMSCPAPVRCKRFLVNTFIVGGQSKNWVSPVSTTGLQNISTQQRYCAAQQRYLESARPE